MSKITNLRLSGSDLKLYILDNFINKETKKKVSVRAFVSYFWKNIGGCATTTGSFTYWTKHPTIVNAEPYAGRAINDKLIYDYACDKCIISKNLVSFEEFRGKTEKALSSKSKVINRLCKEFNYPMVKDISLDLIEKAIRYIYGDKEVDKALKNIDKDIKSELKKKGTKSKYEPVAI